MSFIKIVTKQISYAIIISGTFVSTTYSFEFNNKILESLGFEDVDLSGFAGDNEQFTGTYLADIAINEQNVLYNYPIHFYNVDNASHICITDTLLTALPLSNKLKSGAKSKVVNETDEGKCYGLMQYDPAIELNFDDNEQKLQIRMPHAYLVDFDPYWIPPDQRDVGITGLVLDYNLLKTFNRSKNYNNNFHTSNNFSSYGAIGFNLGRFRLRTNYQYSPKNHKKFERTETYGFTDIGSLNAQIYAGELYSRSNIFSSVRFKGISLFTNESMMPSYLQGYAPQITGTATTNAIVTIRQYGNIIKQVQVPPGPFAIANLPSHLSGTVEVTIEESDGSTSQFEVEVTSVPYLTRKGAIRYTVNAGKVANKYSENDIDIKFISMDGSYGLSNMISLIGGINYTTNGEYQAYNIGLGMNLGIFGGLSFDVTTSENKANSEQRLTGKSYSFNYAKRFNQNTSLNIAGYRFSSRNYTTLNNYVHFKSGNFNQINLEKNRFSLSISQYVPEWDISLSATASKSTFWNQASNSYYNISAHKRIQKGLLKDASISVNLSHNKNGNSKNNNSIGVSFSIPLKDNSASISYNTNYNDSAQQISQNATLYNSGLGGYYSLGVSTRHKRDLSGSVDYALNASYSKSDLSFGSLSSAANYTKNQQYLSAGFSGSLTITQHGLATHHQVYNDGSRLIVDTGVSGVDIQGYGKSNIFGLIGVSNIPDYYQSSYLINNDNLPDNVEIQDNVMEVTPTQGAIAYRSARAISGDKALIVISMLDGSHPPFGAIVYRENGQDLEVGMVADKGRTYLSGLNQKSKFIVKWGQNQSCTLHIDSPKNLTNVICE